MTPLRPKLPPPVLTIPPTFDPNLTTSVNAPPTTAITPTTTNPGPNISLDMFAIMQDFKSSACVRHPFFVFVGALSPPFHPAQHPLQELPTHPPTARTAHSRSHRS